MRTSPQAILVCSIALLALSLGTSLASANRSIALRGSERGVASSGAVTFGEGPRLEFGSITCDVTLLKTLQSSIPKVAGTPFGKVTGIAIDRGTPAATHCRLDRVDSLQNIVPLSEGGIPGLHTELGAGILLYTITGSKAGLLWRLIYDSFSGTLPELSAINYHIQGAQIRLNYTAAPLQLECLYEGDWFKQIQIARGTAATLRIVLARNRWRRVESSLACPEEDTASGDLTLRPTLTIRLV